MEKEFIIPYKDGEMGAIPTKIDEKVPIYDIYVAGAPPVIIDWEKGFDVRNIIGADIPLKNQALSLSCVGQAVSYDVWVKQIIEMIEKYNMKLPELLINHQIGRAHV